MVRPLYSFGVIILTGDNHGGEHKDEAFCSGGNQKIRAASDSGIAYVSIQVKQGSLDAFTADDAIMC